MELEVRVRSLLREISLATSLYSFHIPDQPQLLEIIAIGWDAVPILLVHLLESKMAEQAKYENYDFHDFAPWYAIMALGQITGANPIKPDHAGRLFDIIDDWLAWTPEDDDAGGNLTYWPEGI